MDAPNRKRPRHKVSSSIQNNNSLPIASSSNQSHLGSIISSLRSLPNPVPSILRKLNPKRPRHHEVAPSSKQSHLSSIISTLLSFPDSSLSLPSSSSVERVLDKALVSASDDVSVQNSHMNRILEVCSLLQESTKRCLRKRASDHNSNSWYLPPEITTKVFSKLDTKSLMQAMVCCTMFKKCAMDPSSYSHINLTTSAKNVDNGVVRTMIHRAGKELRFLELGHSDHKAKAAPPLLTGSCLDPMSENQGFIGKCLRTVHLYDVRYMKTNSGKSSFAGLAACSNITDLKIVGQYAPSEQLLKSLTENCRAIEKLFLETWPLQGRSRKELAALVEFLTNIPNLTSLTLIGFRINDATAQKLLENARKLKYMNLTRNSSIKGQFLRDSGHSFHDSPLETLILRDCSLEETEVVQFLNSLSTGIFRSIRHIDVSNNRGLLSEGGIRCYKLNFPLERLKEEGLNVKVVADLNPPSSSRSETPPRSAMHSVSDSDSDGDDELDAAN